MLLMLLLHAMATNGDAHKVVIKVWGMELVNTVKQLTNVTNVTLASDDDKRRRSQSCYKDWGHRVGKHYSAAD